MAAGTRKGSRPPGGDARYRRIYAVVAAIPRGKVASYGEVAARAGLGRGARLVGRALAECPAGLPWHRVVNAAGRISLPRGSAGWTEQVRRLRSEGLTVSDGRVMTDGPLGRAAGLDALLWGPPAGRRSGRGARA